MANRKRPVNRAAPRRPAAARNTSSRTTAADVRSTETTRSTETGTAAKISTRPDRRSTQRGLGRTKITAPQPYSKPARPGGFWRNWGVATVAGVVAVLLAALAVVGALRPGLDDSNRAYVDNKATDQVKAAADHALNVLYAYKASDIDKDKWKAAADAVLTKNMQDQFGKYIDTTIDSVKQAQTDTQVKADPIGVTLLTDDRAELLINMSVDTVKDNKPEPLVGGPIVVRMQKQNGAWLVSEIPDI
ncbi:hypothetical protein [Nocardia sp. NBC_00511]|uniref:hypothetical protein n=1 Tax=Nocardia sp. NBC_00511 TaxID=2903591 RepID=UPI0030E3A9C5